MEEGPPIRKRMRRREVAGSIRFVTFSCQNRLPLFKHPAICELLLSRLASARADQGLQIFAWVIMPEHVHLLCLPRLSGSGPSLGSTLGRIKISVATVVLARWKELGAPILGRIEDAAGRPRFWLKGGGFDRNVRGTNEFSREVRYIHRNPVERGLVEQPEDWRWSSVRWWMGERAGEFECDPPPGEWGEWKGFK